MDNAKLPLETTSERVGGVALAVSLTVAAGVYRILADHRLETTAALFLGIPAVLAILLACTPKAKTVTGGILKGITLLLLIVSPLLGEGWFCILIAAPLFYAVGLLVALVVHWSDRWKRRARGATLSCLTLLLLPMSLEGVLPELTFDREQTVEVTRVVAATPPQVEGALAGSPRLDSRLPLLLRIGFPIPLEAHGAGLAPGDTRTIRFSGVEGAPPGDMIMRITESRPGFARSEAVADGSKLAHWMHWQSSEVAWRPLDATHTEVTWRIRFARELDPAWYFVPWERAAVRAAAGYMIQANATPAEPQP